MSFENVVLKYAHPHVMVLVEDNTIYQESFLTPEVPVTMIQCGAFASGRDNTLLYCENYNEFINEFGEPNYALYGQPGYNIVNALRTGNAAAYVMRVMPDNAKHANLVVMVEYGIVEGEEDELGNKTKTLSLKYTYETIDGPASSPDDIIGGVNTLLKDDPEDNGNYKAPLFYVYQSGRGTYGNATRIRLSNATEYDAEEVNYVNYKLDVLQNGSSLVTKEAIYGGFNPDLFDAASSESLYLEDLVNDPENGSALIRIGVIDSTVSRIVDMYNKTFDANETNSTLDILFGRTLAGDTNSHLDIVMDGLADTAGVSLYSGDDGDFDVNVPDRDEKITACLDAAYSGVYDKRIQSRYSTPADFMPDANFDNDVKIKMWDLACKRKWDAMFYMDSGLLTTTDETIKWLEQMSGYYGNNVIKELHHYKIRDTKFTGKTIPVTTTYFLCGKIPQHFKTRGLSTPMVLEEARITDAVKGTFLPVIDPDEDDIKNQIYKLRGNYYETVKYGIYQRGCCITTQKETSDRLDEFNEYILQLAVKRCEDIMRGKIYKLGEAEDRAMYKTLAENSLNIELGSLVRSATVDFKMSAADERRNIMRIQLRIVYKTVVKRGIVEIYLDPRA